MGTHPIFESDFDCLTDFRMASSRIIWGGLGALSLGALGVNSMYTVEGGHRAVIFSRFGGVGGEIKTECLNFRIPWLEWPLIYEWSTSAFASFTALTLGLFNLLLKILEKILRKRFCLLLLMKL